MQVDLLLLTPQGRRQKAIFLNISNIKRNDTDISGIKKGWWGSTPQKKKKHTIEVSYLKGNMINCEQAQFFLATALRYSKNQY